MPIFKAIFICNVVTPKIFAGLSVTLTRQSSSTLNYALAYAERGETWAFLGDFTGQRPTAYPKARSDAERAVAIAPALAEARASLGWVRLLPELEISRRPLAS